MSWNQSTLRSVDRLVAGVLLAASLVVILCLGYKSLWAPFDYDEAYNLQVVDMLSQSGSYASYGALRGEGPWLFDPHITTGPVVLGPLAIVWKLFGGNVLAIRLLMLTCVGMYVLGLYMLARSRESGLLGFAVAAALAASILPLQTGLVLGEVPATAAVVWSAWLASRGRLGWAALLAGLAVQIKLIYGLAGVIVLFCFVISGSPAGRRHSIVGIVRAGVVMAVPSLLFELWRLIAMGSLTRYGQSLRELDNFLKGQNINSSGTWLSAQPLGAKMVGLFQAMPSPSWMAVGVGLAFIAFGCAFLLSRDWSEPKGGGQSMPEPIALPRLVGMTSLILAGAAMLLGWITQSSQLSTRQALPFLLLAVPALGAMASLHFVQCRSAWLPHRLGNWIALAGLLLWSALLLASLWKTLGAAADLSYVKAATEERRKVVEVIKRENPQTLFVDDWWQNPEYQLASGIRGTPVRSDSPQLLIVQDYQVSLLGQQWAKYQEKCVDTIYSSSMTLVCRLPAMRSSVQSLDVLDWGPRSATVGVNPNEQRDGGVGIWIKIKKIDASTLGPIKLYAAGIPAFHTGLVPGGELITASVPKNILAEKGQLELAVKQVGTGRSLWVGHFSVN